MWAKARARAAPRGRGRGRAAPAVPDIPPGAYQVQFSTGAGAVRKKLKWRATTQAPLTMARNLRSIDAERWARRPSALVKVAGKRYATEHLVADEYEGCRDDFSLEDPMPDENMEEDVG